MTIKQPKAIFFDVDGTLLSFKTHTIPQSTLNALAALKEKGIKVFIATGRSGIELHSLGDNKFDGYITINGGYCTTGDGKLISKKHIPAEDVKAFVDYQTEVAPIPCIFVGEHEMFLNFVNDDVQTILDMLNFRPPTIKDSKAALDIEILQLVAFFKADEEAKIMSEVLPNCDSARWHPLFTDALAKGTSKQTGIDQVLEHYGIDLSETMAFGDGGNDIPMLKHVATGIAMGNAADNVKVHADYVTSSVDDDGIYNALKHFGVI